MNERTQLSIKLILSHTVLIPVLILISSLINQDSFLLLSVTQTILVILFLSGYWEFLGLRFKITYFISMQTLVLLALLFKIFSQTAGGKNWYLITILILLQTYLLIELIKIIIIIFRRENVTVEIVFPFKQGKYLITDGGNSKLSRLMNYHYFSPIHKKNKTNSSMLFATDIVKLINFKSNFLRGQNEDYPIFGEKVLSPIGGVVVKAVIWLRREIM